MRAGVVTAAGQHVQLVLVFYQYFNGAVDALADQLLACAPTVATTARGVTALGAVGPAVFTKSALGHTAHGAAAHLGTVLANVFVALPAPGRVHTVVAMQLFAHITVVVIVTVAAQVPCALGTGLGAVLALTAPATLTRVGAVVARDVPAVTTRAQVFACASLAALPAILEE